MILRATAVQRRVGPSGQAYIDGRYEVQWVTYGPWLPMGGISETTEEEWLLVASLMELGARAARRSAGPTFANWANVPIVSFQLVDAIPVHETNERSR